MTKRETVDENEARLQLGTWVSAQFRLLQQLIYKGLADAKARLRDKSQLFSLLALSVHGHRWLLMITNIHENGRIDLFKQFHLGFTDSYAGITKSLLPYGGLHSEQMTAIDPGLRKRP